MRRAVPYLFFSLLTLPLSHANLHADGAPPEDEYFPATPSPRKSKGFTGKVTRNRVRLRLSPSTDSPVVREMDKGDMLVVTGESDEFYSVEPPSETRAYLYRTYVLDGVVEGNKVNVRLDPHLEAPVIAQLNTGDRVDGKISDKNSKWLEIDPPASTRFYISSDYVEKVGDANFLAKFEARQKEVNDLLNSTYIMSESELEKHFADMDPKTIQENYEVIISDYSDFPEQVKQARKYLSQFNEAFLRKKVEYLEAKTADHSDRWSHMTSNRPEENRDYPKERRREQSEASYNLTPSQIYEKWVSENHASEVNARMALWIPVEIAYYQKWAEKNNNSSIQEFYTEQKGQAVALRGIIEAYDRPVRNKPGDYLLVNRTNRLPIAYLYSTHINLSDKVGQEVTVEGILRPNHNFAYPAYFVIEAE